MSHIFGKVVLFIIFGGATVFMFFVISQQTYNSSALNKDKAYEIDTDAGLGIEITADSWGIFDVVSGEVLYGENIHKVKSIASVTKLFSARTAHSYEDTESSIKVSWEILSTEGRSGKLKYGEEFTRTELLFPLLLESSNDAAEALARFSEREEYISNMNSFVQEIGLQETKFVDPSGLGAGNVSTVSDLAFFVSDTAKRDGYIFDITQLEKYIGLNHTWWNSSPARTFEGYKGGKHGYTDEAKETIVALFEISLRNDVVRELGIIVLGSINIEEDVAVLRKFIQQHIAYK